MEIPPEYLPGHTELAAYISIDPDFQIYRKFTSLTTRNILYLQSELTSLQQWFEDFDKIEREQLDSASFDEKMDIRYCNQNWNAFMHQAERGTQADPSDADRRQATKLSQISRLRKITAEYRCNQELFFLVNG